MIMDTTLSRVADIANFKRALAQAQTIPEVKNIRDQAEALRQCARLAGWGLEKQNAIAEIKIQAERQAGALLDELIPAQGGRPPRNLDSESRFAAPLTLADLGISHHQAKRWRLEASLPEDIFNQHVAEVKAKGQELTSAGICRLAKEWQKAASEASSSTPATQQMDAVADDPVTEAVDYCFQDTWLTLWPYEAENLEVLSDRAVTITVTNGEGDSRCYVLEVAPGCRLQVKENTLTTVLH